MEHTELIQNLWNHQDLSYREMQLRILPDVPQDRIIGVRTPVLRVLAKQFSGGECFLQSLPHQYFEEDQIHGFLIAAEKDFPKTISLLDCFLPYINNWATCDQLTPTVFRKHHSELLPHIERWIASQNPYAVRFGLKMLMDHFLDADFLPGYLEMAATVKREEYYIRMMVAWYFATALAKQYDAAYPIIQQHKLDKWTHNKAIQKAVESFRVTPEHKEQLKKLKIK